MFPILYYFLLIFLIAKKLFCIPNKIIWILFFIICLCIFFPLIVYSRKIALLFSLLPPFFLSSVFLLREFSSDRRRWTRSRSSWLGRWGMRCGRWACGRHPGPRIRICAAPQRVPPTNETSFRRSVRFRIARWPISFPPFLFFSSSFPSITRGYDWGRNAQHSKADISIFFCVRSWCPRMDRYTGRSPVQFEAPWLWHWAPFLMPLEQRGPRRYSCHFTSPCIPPSHRLLWAGYIIDS